MPQEESKTTEGARVQNEFSLHKEYDPQKCSLVTSGSYELCNTEKRVVLCDNSEWDIVECRHCGEQRKRRCNFDEDMS